MTNLTRTHALLVGLVTTGLVFAFSTGPAFAQAGAARGKLQGKVLAADTGGPMASAEVVLLPADSTMKKVGAMTNADGTFLLEAAPGRYTLQVRMISYATTRIQDVSLASGKLSTLTATLKPEAIQQEQVEVTAKAIQNTEASMLVARQKANAVGDAVSAEQVRRSPDKDAAEILRRVTGLSVSDNKYVFVRGLGERYSSTEVDGVRVPSPEQNKRVVPLDLVPAGLVENINIQKTYTADLPGEFGGGDVQVQTQDFPGAQSWSLSASQGATTNSTFRDGLTYSSKGADSFGFGSAGRQIPQEVYDVTGGRPLFESSNPARGFPKSTLAAVAQSFENVWTPHGEVTPPNGTFALSYGNQVKALGRDLGFIVSGTMQRSHEQQAESQRFFQGTTDTLYDYGVQRDRESVELGAISGLSYRISPQHSLHLRGLFTNSADDEVRQYEGPDHNRIESTTGGWLVHRATRLMYVQRSVLSGSLEGRHEFPQWRSVSLDWKVNAARARRQQPDRREVVYDQRYYDDGTGNLVGYWALGSTGSREYGDLTEDGRGLNLKASLPYQWASYGRGKVMAGFDHQYKTRDNFYRRFNFYPNANADRTLPPDSLFGSSAYDSTANSAYVSEATLNIDNYDAKQQVTAGFVSVDVPFGEHLRGNFGVRAEHGLQDVRTFDLFSPGTTTAEGKLDDTDWLPAGNITYSVGRATNVRAAASRTVSRPDLNELSPSPSLEYVGGFQVGGNPDLKRATIDNYDLRLESFIGLSEVLAAGVFYKGMNQPIEQVIQGGAPPVLTPRNSDHGRNMGVELEVRSNLGRIRPELRNFSINSNATFISSEIHLVPQLSELGSAVHPLQGQANYLANVGLSYATPWNHLEATFLVASVGRRLRALGLNPLPDVYEQPTTMLDATVAMTPFRGARLKLGAKNLTNPLVRQLQGGREVSSYRTGASYSLALSYGQ